MEYRLICVYKSNKNVLNQVDIEVNRDLHTSTLAPFMRKVSVEELIYSDLTSPKDFVSLLNQLGYDKQPFVLKGDLLHNSKVQALLTKNRWNYRQDGRGSIKKCEPMSFVVSKKRIPVGTLLCGELYITDISHWKNHIKVRWSYSDSILPFYPVYNSLPCRTNENVLFQRDQEGENKLLADIEPYIDNNGLDISLPTYDVDFLKSLAEKHWKIYVEGNKGKKTEVHAHQNKSGIVWFDNNEHVDDKNGIISQMLNSYLHGRNYVEVGSSISLFRSNDVIKQNEEAITANIFPGGESIEKIYSKNVPLSSSETEYIEDKIKEGVSATLRQYQWKGVLWLATMRKNHKGCLLADEMGLGKTLQVLSHLYAIKETEAPFLIITPTSLLPNWENEIKKFLPSWTNSIDVQDHNPDKKHKIILVSYDILRLNISAYKKLYYDTIVIDEAQIVKNRDTKKYQTIKQLKAFHRIILTGTPIENSINDIWSHFMILMPQLCYVFKTITKDKTSINSSESMELSKKLLKPFILRRTKEEELKNLPNLYIENVYIELSPRERTIYNNVKAVFLKALQTGVSGRLNSIALEGLMRLRQACISPNMLPPTLYSAKRFQSSKMKEAIKLTQNSILDYGKVLVFSQYVKALEELDNYLSEMSLEHVHLYGNTTNRKVCVDAFQNNDNIKVFLISIKAGGFGLNLTAANCVILLDDWWNPAVEDQAFARAHRIGQKRKVHVFRLVCKNTVEEKILQLQDKKRETVDIFNANGSKLTLEEIKYLID